MVEVEVQGEHIVAVRPCHAVPVDEWISPGLVDLQVNGFGGVDLNGDACTTEDIVRLTLHLARLGTTTFVPTVITAPRDSMAQRLRTIATARKESPEVRHAVPCIHLEGPWLSPEEGFRGAHPADDVRAPSMSQFEELQRAADGRIGMVTLSPHWPGTVPFVQALTDHGIVVAIGHTHASAEQIRAAVDAGARLSTHLGNAVAAVLPRHENSIWPQLAEDRLTASLIADGIHLPRDVFRVMLRAKGTARCVLVSDAVALAGQAPGAYVSHIGGNVVVGDDGSVRMAGTGLLAGSGISLNDAVATALAMSQCSLAEAVRMASSNPAALLALDRGRLRPGSPADILLFQWSPGDTSLRIGTTVACGRVVEQQR